jgi:hypothetical protein
VAIIEKEVNMKKNVLVGFFLMAALVLFTGNLFSNAPPEGNSLGAPIPSAWKTLKSIQSLKNFCPKEVQPGVLEFKMGIIKQALEKAGVNEPVTILYVGGDGITYNLGTYAPIPPKSKEPKRSPLDPRLINPQPEPPDWSSISLLKQIKKTPPTKKLLVSLKTKPTLIFKDAKGQLKAEVELNMQK